MYQGKCSLFLAPLFFILLLDKNMTVKPVKIVKQQTFLSMTHKRKKNFKCWNLKNAIYRSTLVHCPPVLKSRGGGLTSLHTLLTNQWNCSEYWKIEEVLYNTIVSTSVQVSKYFFMLYLIKKCSYLANEWDNHLKKQKGKKCERGAEKIRRLQ